MKLLIRVLNTQPNFVYFSFLVFICLKHINTLFNSYFNVFVFFCYSPAMWTFQEYLAHRYLMHHFEPIKKIHFKHHFDPQDKNKIFIPIFFTLLNSIFNLTIISIFFNYEVVMLNYSSFVLCYLLFEYVHWSCHNNTIEFLKGPRIFHTLHHTKKYDNMNVYNYGFTSASWDIIFNTCDPLTLNKKYSFLLLIPFPVLPMIFVELLN